MTTSTRVPFATDLKTRRALVPALGTAVTGVQMLDNGKGYIRSPLYSFSVPIAQAGMTNFRTKAQSWNGTVFCLVGVVSNTYTTHCYTSPDGVTWALQTGMPNGKWFALDWDGTVFCAGGTLASTGDAVITTSPDGIIWTTAVVIRTTGLADTAVDHITYGNGTFVLFGHWGSQFNYTQSYSYYSLDHGVTWFNSWTGGNTATFDPGSGVVLYGTPGGAKQFILTGYNTGSGYFYYTSSDGHSWVSHTAPAMAGYIPWAWNGALYAVVTGTTAYYTSADGGSWAVHTAPAAFGLLTAVNGIFLAVQATNTNTLYLSSDGVNWTAVILAGTPLAWSSSGELGSSFTKFFLVDAEATPKTITEIGYTLVGATYSLVFSGGVGAGAAGTYTTDAFGTVISNPVITAGGSYSTLPQVSFPYGGGSGALGQVLPIQAPYIPPSIDARLTNAYVETEKTREPVAVKRPSVQTFLTIGAGKAQGGIAVGAHVFTLNGDIGLLT